MTSFLFTYPDFTHVKTVHWYPEALTFAIIVIFNDGATVKGSISGVSFGWLWDQATAAGIPIHELCHFCKINIANPRLTTDGDEIIICDECCKTEEF